MGSGVLSKDSNFVTSIGGVSSSSDTQVRSFQYNPATRGMTVHIVGDDVGLLSPTKNYGISNTEDTGTYKYYGFEDKDGNWYILRKTIATNTYLYTAGSSDYNTGWTNRASHSYDSFAATFS